MRRIIILSVCRCRGRNGHVAGSGTYTLSTTTDIPASVVEDLIVKVRTTSRREFYEATNSITFDPNFTSGIEDAFEARILEATTYYPTGSNSGGAWESGNGSRYGFNGKENDNSTGEGNLDFGARVYDGRLGRFLSVDPYTNKYPFESSYSFAANSPIIAIDQDGKFPVWTHYQMVYENLLKAKVDKKTAHEIALFGSTFTDHPTDWYVMPYNKFLAVNYIYSASRLNYDQEDYKETINSQSDELVLSVSIHGMRTWWEKIKPEQAVNRALYGGTFKERDGTLIRIKGAYETINELKGRNISKLNRVEKKVLAQALHTIEDVEVHKGARWVNQHKKEAKKMGHTNEHPDTNEVPVNKKEHDQADAATKATIKKLQTGN